MKTLADFQEILGRVQYKPGWQLRCHESSAGTIYLQAHFIGTDPQTHVVGVQGGRKWHLSPHMTEGEVVQTALMAVLAAEEHEAREFFTYRGRAIFGPHFSLQKLVAICDAGATEHRAPPSPSASMSGENICTRCGSRIEFTDAAWAHVGGCDPHPAVPHFHRNQTGINHRQLVDAAPECPSGKTEARSSAIR